MSEGMLDSWHQSYVLDAVQETQWELQRPSMMLRPNVHRYGEGWCALYGDKIISGVAGFGKTPEQATRDFDDKWYGRGKYKIEATTGENNETEKTE